MKKYNKFTLVLDGHYTFELTRSNYAKIISNSTLVNAIDRMLSDIDTLKVYGMVDRVTYGYMLQISLHK